MKNWLFLLSIFLWGVSFASPIQDRKIDPVALSQLAAALDIPQDKDIVEATQERWLRRPDQERWELAELSSKQKIFVLKWAAAEGLYSPWKPLCKEYDKALILGATTSRMQMRLDYLKQLWDEGVRFSEIIWLTGDRPLDKRVDELTDRCSNESEAARVIWEETNLPDEMRKVEVLFVAVPMKVAGSTKKRPNTEDTLVAWLKIEPKPSRALFVSDQPFCGYQFAVVKGALPEEFMFDLVGPGVDPASHPAAAAITLDSIARWIYQERLNEKNAIKNP